ncbi:hypothetical protein OSTOST_09174 [Ostertagia ostertagi]
MLRGTFQTVKLFALGVLLMIIFMAIAFHHIPWKSQPILIIGAVGSPAIATATTFAILGWLDFPFNSIMCITPFLVMGIEEHELPSSHKPDERSDFRSSTMLLRSVHSWRTHSSLPAKERMRMVVHEIGPSMAITSVTNTLAFGIGITSPTPQARHTITWESYTNMLLSPFGKFIVVVTTLAIYYAPINFISLLPPLTDYSEKANFFEMIGRVEHSDGCYGPERTQIMLRQFIERDRVQESRPGLGVTWVAAIDTR